MKRSTLFALILFLVTQAKTQAQQSQDTGVIQLSLEQAKAYAVEHSYFTRQAVMDAEIAEKRVKETTAIGLPQVNASGSFNQNIDLPTQLVPDFTGQTDRLQEIQFGTTYSLTGGVQVNQLLFNGSYIVGLQAARVYRELAYNSQERTELEIRDQATQAYSAVLVAKENVETLDSNVRYLKQTLDETRLLYEEGFAAEQDADQLEILYGSAENSYKDAVRYLEISENLFKFTLGIPIEKDVELTEGLDNVLAYGQTQTVLQQQFSYVNNIDFKIAETNRELQKLNLRNVKTEYMPTLNAFYSYQQQFYNNELEIGDGDFWFPASLWGLNLNVPIFSSGQRHFKAQQAKIELDKADLQSEQVSQDLQIQYATARAQYVFALDRYENTKRNLDLVQSILSKEITKYNEGVSTSLNVANTQIQFFEVQSGYIQATQGLIQAKSTLDRILNNQ
jgi:outer membrane protein TolC